MAVRHKLTSNDATATTTGTTWELQENNIQELLKQEDHINLCRSSVVSTAIGMTNYDNKVLPTNVL